LRLRGSFPGRISRALPPVNIESISRMPARNTVLQIIPHPPGVFDGVGDYALNLARALSAGHGIGTTFLVAGKTGVTSSEDYPVIFGLNSANCSEFARDHANIILHYVNYAYQARGIPFALVPIVRQLRHDGRGRFLTIFHELYASGPPWKSSFWLQPLQKRIARSIAQHSSVCLVSSDSMRRQLESLTSGAEAIVNPVLSNFGEPELLPDQFSQRDPHRWTICGGTALIERSLQSFRKIIDRVPEEISPRQLFVLGGNDSLTVRALLPDSGIQIDYRPRLTSADASGILSTSSFVWLDYFTRSGVPGDVLLKSTAFAAACAHGAIPVFPHRSSVISVEADPLPGPFFIEPARSELPAANARAQIAARFYDWYRRHASSNHLARGIGRALELRPELES
jgi:hypothetical protein